MKNIVYTKKVGLSSMPQSYIKSERGTLHWSLLGLLPVPSCPFSDVHSIIFLPETPVGRALKALNITKFLYWQWVTFFF